MFNFNTDVQQYRQVALMMKQHHVVPSSEGGWEVKESNNPTALCHFTTKADAIDYARGVSRENRTELIIHDKQGRIIESDSHGNDPHPPQG